MLSQKHSLCVVDMTVLERQQERFKWLQQQQHSFVNQNNNGVVSCPMDQFQGFFDQGVVNADMIGWKKSPEICLISNELTKYGHLFMDGAEFVGDKMEFARNDDHCLSRSSSCQVGVLEAAKMEEEMVEVEVEKTQFSHGRGNSSKRKAEFVPSEECKDKKNKGELGLLSKVAEKSNTEMSVDSSKENGKTSECQKPDFIHVRARRGQATDSHSLAERARREKISKKMKNLQDLVPGCNKITGRAGMLDEIINYVQSLQRQVEFLSMKLAAVSPGPEINIENFFGKEVRLQATSNLLNATMSSAMANLTHLQLNLVQQLTSVSEPEVLANPPQTNPSGFIPEMCLDSSCFPQVQAFWDADSQNLRNAGYHQN